MQLEKVEYAKAHTTGGRPSFLAAAEAAHAFRLHPRFLVVFFAATACLALSATVLAQHPAPHGSSAQGAAKTRVADDESIRPFHISVPEEALVGPAGALFFYCQPGAQRHPAALGVSG